MNSVSISKEEAEKNLLKAFRDKCKKNDYSSSKIKGILKGSHKTYKYVLITGLLAKATNENANPLALQAGSSFAWSI